jgi:hypothetical protein
MGRAAARDVQLTASEEQELGQAIVSFAHDAVGFIMFALPWGESGTALENETGPDTWQIEVLRALTGGEPPRGAPVEPIYTPKNIPASISLREVERMATQIAVASGHGIGKSALVAWIILWFISTRPNPQIVVTANTQTQLTTKTWRELAKWHKLCIHRHWFTWTATKFYLNESPETSFAQAVPWSETNSEAFAGTHEEHVLMIFDEASAIVDKIWEVAEGAMTTPGAKWVCFGNPTRNTGRFRECFGRFRNRWWRKQVDSRDAKMADKRKIQEWVEDYGEDSDFVRVRVRGVFPRAANNQFIASDVVQKARERNLPVDVYQHAPKVMGVDVAREGDDQSVILLRQGPKVFPPKRYRVPNLMQLASIVAEQIEKEQPDAVMIDGTGMGAGVVDRLRQLRFQVISVLVGSKAVLKPDKYFNTRAEIWGRMKDWLEEDVDLPDDNEIEDDLIGPEYGFDIQDRIQLEKKSDMKKRGLASPDNGDALSLTFYASVAKTFQSKRRNRRRNWRTV